MHRKCGGGRIFHCCVEKGIPESMGSAISNPHPGYHAFSSWLQLKSGLPKRKGQSREWRERAEIVDAAGRSNELYRGFMGRRWELDGIIQMVGIHVMDSAFLFALLLEDVVYCKVFQQETSYEDVTYDCYRAWIFIEWDGALFCAMYLAPAGGNSTFYSSVNTWALPRVDWSTSKTLKCVRESRIAGYRDD